MKPFLPGDDQLERHDASTPFLRRILALSEVDVSDDVGGGLRWLWWTSSQPRCNLGDPLCYVVARVGAIDGVSEARRLLIGAYFSHEYSVEAAALGNPSIVEAPDQSALAAGEVRFVMSLRAIGEGHVSSIEFRTGSHRGGSRDPLRDTQRLSGSWRASPGRVRKEILRNQTARPWSTRRHRRADSR